MGTYYTYAPETTLKQFVADALEGSSATDYAVVGSCAYILRPQGLEVWKLSRHEGHIGYKPIHEEAFPYFFDCPKRLLDAAPETTDPEALAWRAACHETRKRRNRARRISDGTTIETASPLNYGGFTETRFTAERWYDGRRVWRCASNGKVVRISKLETRDFRVIEATDA